MITRFRRIEHFPMKHNSTVVARNLVHHLPLFVFDLSDSELLVNNLISPLLRIFFFADGFAKAETPASLPPAATDSTEARSSNSRSSRSHGRRSRAHHGALTPTRNANHGHTKTNVPRAVVCSAPMRVSEVSVALEMGTELRDGTYGNFLASCKTETSGSEVSLHYLSALRARGA